MKTKHEADGSPLPIYFNRELSWIEFNARVLNEAKNPDNPLFERIKYLSIVSSNFDEFFMVRVAGLKKQAQIDPKWKDSAKLTANEQLFLISKRVQELFQQQHQLFKDEILPALRHEGIVHIHPSKFTTEDTAFTENYFKDQVFPLLTPLRSKTKEALPPITNLKIHVAFLLKPHTENNPLYASEPEEKLLAFVRVPSLLDQIVWLPSHISEKRFTLIEDIIAMYGESLFSGYSVEGTCIFEAVCDADFTVKEDNPNFIKAMEEVLNARRKSIPIRLTCKYAINEVTKLIINKTFLNADDVYCTNIDFLSLKTFAKLSNLDGFEHLRFPPWKKAASTSFIENKPLWDVIKKKDVLLHVPYESYDPVLQFLKDAAEDKDVLSIKMTLYRTSGNSPIIKSLIKAAKQGKQVTVFVELKARFDEERNIVWAHQLQQAGAIVIYGLVDLKVHAKILVVVRKEEKGLVSYVHMGTGNYNEKTAGLYADLSLFTTNADIAHDASLIFNMISGYSHIQNLNKLCIAPVHLKQKLLSLIDREIAASSKEKPGLIMAKMNSLAHIEIIKALYKASCNNVKVLLNIRGICMLVPGVANLSENIRVISIVDRFLEHSRIFYFQNGGNDEAYLSSADWMPRNLERRVELMFPVLQEDIFSEIKTILDIYFLDNQKAHILNSDGTWSVPSQNIEEKHRAQKSLHDFYSDRK